MSIYSVRRLSSVFSPKVIRGFGTVRPLASVTSDHQSKIRNLVVAELVDRCLGFGCGGDTEVEGTVKGKREEGHLRSRPPGRGCGGCRSWRVVERREEEREEAKMVCHMSCLCDRDEMVAHIPF